MNGHLAKEQRRNLRKEMGAAAVDAVERCTTTVQTLSVQHAALARELVEEKKVRASLAPAASVQLCFERIKETNARVDAATAWCLKLEAAAKGFERVCDADAGSTHQRLDRFEDLTFVQRLTWLFFGTLPSLVNPASLPHSDDNEAHLS